MQTLLYTGAHKLLFRNLLHGLERYKTYSHLQSERCLRTEKNDPSGNVFSTLSHTPHPTLQRPLYTSDELRSESSLLILAGSDTTSTCIAATLFYLLHNAPALARLHADIDATFPSLEAIRSGPLLSRCQYLRACITESLRLSPPVGGLMAREVLTGGIEVDGRVFPKGTEIGTPHYALHHDAAYYPAPFLYQPERWLAGAGHDVATAQSAFGAFSLGPRGCVGKAMAYQELMTVLARVLWQYDVRFASQNWLGGGGGHEKWRGSRDRADEYQLFDTFSSRSVGPLVQFRPRRHAGL